MTSVILLKAPAKSVMSNTQKAFNRLKKKIETLQLKLKNVHSEMDECLNYYYAELEPVKVALATLIEEFCVLLFDHYKNTKLTRNEKESLKELLLLKIQEVINLYDINTVSVEVREMFQDLEGVSYEEYIAGEVSELQKSIKDDFGVDLDLSSMGKGASQEEMLKHFMEAMQNAEMEFKAEVKPKKKTKKELEREAKAQKLESLQKEGLGTIYKQLAKAFHPDLERDPQQKVEKEILMKQLTTAYDEKDLHTILSLEMEWMSRSGNQGKNQTDDQLKVYISLLKEQVYTLEAEIDMVGLHPKYFPIHNFLNGNSRDAFFMLRMVQKEMKEDIGVYQAVLKGMKGDKAVMYLRDLLNDR